MERRFQPELMVISSIHVRRVLEMTQLDSLFEIYETLDQALQAGTNVPDVPA
jgi:anti-anti-sigma regulatory factor